MCELLGINFNQPIDPAISFRGFRRRSSSNPHGWGVAWFEGRSVKIEKQPCAALNSPVVESIVHKMHPMRSKTFIGHVRYKTHGPSSLENTHPFAASFRGRDAVLAHNGGISQTGALRALGQYFQPKGETDSETLFSALLARMEADGLEFTDFLSIHEILSDINNLGTMNLLFSDGSHLFAYVDRHGHKGLEYVQRKSPFHAIRLKDDDWAIDLHDEKHPQQKGFILATRALTDEAWRPLKAGGLYVMKDGDPVFGF